MELSVKKINKAMESFIDKENYKNYINRFMFDYISDSDYVYLIIETHYVIRLPRDIAPDILTVDKCYDIKTDINVERMINGVINNKSHTDFYINGIINHKGKELVEFIDDNDHKVYVDSNFFKQFYNKPITKYGVPENITFSANSQNSEKSPLIMWENDEVVAMFLPIVRL